MRTLMRRAAPRAADRPPTRRAGGNMIHSAAGWPPESGRGTRFGAPSNVSVALTIIGFLARRLGALPRFVHERDDRTRRPVRSPEFEYLWNAPNRSEDSVPFWTTAMAHLEGWSEMILWRRTVGSRTVGLDVLHPNDVDVKKDRSGDRIYTLYGDDKQRYSRDEIVHVIGGVSWDGVRGVPPVRAGLGAHEIAQLQDRWQRNFLRRGSAPSGVVSSPSELDDTAVDEFYDLWDEQHGGPEGVGGVILVQGGATYTPVTIPPAEAQLLQARQYSREEILGLYAPGMPHHLVGWKSNTSNWGTGIEAQGIHLVQHVFMLRLDLISDVVSRALLPPELKVGFDYGQWIRGDAKTQAEVLWKMRQGGVLTRDEWRAEAGRPVIESAADDVWKPQNMESIPVDGSTRVEPAPDDD